MRSDGSCGSPDLIDLSRRSFLGAAASGLAVAADGGRTSGAGFRHRGYLGWITDLATEPDTNAEWPSMRLDEGLLGDYADTFRLMRTSGYNEATIWGFYVSRSWPVDIRSAVSTERGKLVTRLIESAHRQSIRVYSGLGVYSWGFDEIIKANPKLSRTNSHAMCASVPESWEWMQRVIDFVFERFPIDGVSLQSADQGRCKCAECSRIPDPEYHANLNVKVCEYIRSKWRGKTVAINGWGLDFVAGAKALARMSEHADYIIDVRDSLSPQARAALIKSLRCDFGTIGGRQVEPPQHWARDRWFLPTARSQGEHLQTLYKDGGRACEYFFHILANPGDEISFHATGRALTNPETSWRDHLRSTVADLYRVGNSGALDSFCELVVSAEDAYMKYLPDMRSGTISMEPLVSSTPGPPVYLTKRLTPEQRRSYLSEMTRIGKGFQDLAPRVPEKNRMIKILQCIQNVRADLERA